MYLLLLSPTIHQPKPAVKPVPVPVNPPKRAMNSTNVPLAQLYGGPLPEDLTSPAVRYDLGLKNIEWQPIACEGIVVYVRRAYAV